MQLKGSIERFDRCYVLIFSIKFKSQGQMIDNSCPLYSYNCNRMLSVSRLTHRKLCMERLTKSHQDSKPGINYE